MRNEIMQQQQQQLQQLQQQQQQQQTQAQPQQANAYQTYRSQSVPSAVGAYTNAANTAGLSQNVAATVPSNDTSTSPNSPIHMQNGLVQQVTLIADRYLIMDPVEGSTLYKCFDVKANEQLVCKVSSCVRLVFCFLFREEFSLLFEACIERRYSFECVIHFQVLLVF